MKNNRIVKRTRFTYSTRSNKLRIIKTPGNKLNALKLKKKKSNKICPIFTQKIKGVNCPGSRRFKSFSKKSKTVSRPYGGYLSLQAIKRNIIKSFLIEEKKLAKKVSALNKEKSS